MSPSRITHVLLLVLVPTAIAAFVAGRLTASVAPPTTAAQPQPLSALTAGPLGAEAWRALGLPTRQVQFSSTHALSVVTTAASKRFWEQLHGTGSGTWGWEPETQAAFAGCITNETWAIDFGSWVGPTVLWSALLGAAEVYSFEPDAFAFAELLANVKLNGLTNVRLHQGCISPTGGMTQLFLRGGNSVSSTFNLSAGGGSLTPELARYSRTVPVQCWRLDDVIQHNGMRGRPLFIKVDTEGFEVELAPSLKQVALAYRPTLHLSIHALLRNYSAGSWAAIRDLMSVFPVVMQQEGPRFWRQVSAASAVNAWERLPANAEVVLTWPGACAALVAE